MAGIYIPGMELPDKNHVVLLELNYDGKAFAAYDGGRTRLAEFDAIPVPDHGRLIDADALIEQKEWAFDGVGQTEMVNVAEIVNAPTIIPADKDGAE